MNYKGVIIAESLADRKIIDELEIVQKSIEQTNEDCNTPWLDRWSMYTVLIPKDKIDEYTLRISHLIEKEHANNWYCDFRNDKYHYVVFLNKVFKLDRNKKDDYIEMINYATSIGFPKEQLPTFNDLPLNLLTGFLVYAKQNTYANSNAKKIESSRKGSNDYHFEEIIEGEKMTYHDTYFGGTRFMGEEVVYRSTNSPKWGMNYYGITLDESLSEEAMDKALRPALMKVGEDNSVLPLRGPKYFENEGYIYTFKSEGTIENFIGIEEIHKDGKLIYQLKCHGGVIE
ncbi:MAG: hypothetical protein J6B98_00940 [Bacilli bacterium]|nr:hypothetical protein [Bacilli bacterium]